MNKVELEGAGTRLSQPLDKRQTAKAMLDHALQFRPVPEVVRHLLKGVAPEEADLPDQVDKLLLSLEIGE